MMSAPWTVAQRLNYLWRIIAKGISFTCFGIGGIFIGSCLFILYYVNWFEEDRLHQTSRRIVAKTFGVFVWLMKLFGLITWEIRQIERIKSAQAPLIIANHITLIDVVFLAYFAEDANCIVKGALLRNPFTRPPIKACGFINNDSPTLIEDAVSSIEKGEKLIVFPEGTRTPEGQRIRFLRGAFHIAIQAKCNILPVFIDCNPLTLSKNNKWYQLGRTRSHFVFDVQPPIYIAPWLDCENSLSARVRKLTKSVETHYINE